MKAIVVKAYPRQTSFPGQKKPPKQSKRRAPTVPTPLPPRAIPAPRPARAGLPWTRTEDYFLRVRYSKMTMEAMAATLRRSRRAVRLRMELKGLVQKS